MWTEAEQASNRSLSGPNWSGSNCLEKVVVSCFFEWLQSLSCGYIPVLLVRVNVMAMGQRLNFQNRMVGDLEATSNWQCFHTFAALGLPAARGCEFGKYSLMNLGQLLLCTLQMVQSATAVHGCDFKQAVWCRASWMLLKPQSSRQMHRVQILFEKPFNSTDYQKATTAIQGMTLSSHSLQPGHHSCPLHWWLFDTFSHARSSPLFFKLR